MSAIDQKSPDIQASGQLSGQLSGQAPKAPRLDHVLDREKLRAQLTAAALDCIGDEAGARARALKLLHGALFRGRLVAQEYLEAGGSGLAAARLMSAVQDEVIRALHDFATTHFFRARNPTRGEHLAVLAVGGYGRGELAPSSDIDLLFLRSYKENAWSESMIEFMLYMLWDMGMKIGHSSRSVDECLKLARADFTIRTAVMEARPLCGDRALAAGLDRRFWHELAPGSEAAFVSAKLAEREQRLKAAGQSRFMVEPNIKDGKGGLRDLHSLFWISSYVLRARGIEAGGIGGLAELGVFTASEARTFVRALEFLWTVRCHLHFLTGRAEERLTFDLQPEMAKRMGFVGAAGEAPVEAFMRAYFGIAKEVGGLTRILCAKLEAEEQKRSPRGLSRLFEPRVKPLADVANPEQDSGFAVEAGRLAFARPEILGEDAVQLLKLFSEADRRDLDIHPAALSAVSRNLHLVDDELRSDPRAQKVFLEIAASPFAPARALRLMNEAGLLGAFLPEFGAIVARTQFNMYHSFTVDEHTLEAVQTISDIEHGRFRAEHPLASGLFSRLQHRRALYLAMLLHDTGKTGGDQEVAGARSAETACRRLGLPEEEIALVAWLVGHHLRMSDTAQKRDLSDPRTIARFAELVAFPERLRLLLILTVADMRAVGPNVFNGWKGQLLRDLYRLTEAALRGGRADEGAVAAHLAAQASARRGEFAAVTNSEGVNPVARIQETLDDSYWLSFGPEALAWHARVLAASTAGEGGMVVVAARDASDRAATEFLVAAPDRRGLFADLSAIFAAAGANVAQASAHTSSEGVAFDVFAVQNNAGAAFGADDPDRVSRVIHGLRAAAISRESISGESIPTPALRIGRREAAFLIEAHVDIDNSASLSASLVEVSGRDRPGLLAQLAREFANAGLSLRSAHIGACGARVTDSFYVVDAAGEKLTAPDLIAKLRQGLLDVLAAEEPAAPETAARRPLARARVSADR